MSSKSSVLEKIQNPDIPGLEDTPPPPPPPPPPLPPPPPIISGINVNPSEGVKEESYNNRNTIPPASPYMDPMQLHIAAANQPWWIPTEADTSEVYKQWYESAYKAALVASQDKDPGGKPKVKYYKRKAEVVDAKVDAEKVANAQKELSNLMKPLKCDLCNAVMNSTLQAQLHYQGKPHQKKVSMYLNQSAKKVKLEDPQVSSTTATTTTTSSNDWSTYCEMCKIWFTSQTDANQHYTGKKHLKAAFGTIQAKAVKKAQSKIPVDPTGRFGIGGGFQPEPQMPPEPIVPESTPVVLPPVVLPPVVLPPVPQYSQAAIPIPTPLRCEICNISTNRQDQLDTHKRGAKHMKMMKQLNLPLAEDAAVAQANAIDYSIYRTPSGHYYCSPCNLSLNSEITFGQHMESKKHRNQINPKQASQFTNKSKKK